MNEMTDAQERAAHDARVPRGWRCTIAAAYGYHDGPCAAVPKWWNIRGRLWMRKR